MYNDLSIENIADRGEIPKIFIWTVGVFLTACLSPSKIFAFIEKLAREKREDMPTILRIGPYRIYFYSHEPNEPAHVHVDRDSLSAKFWIGPISLARNYGYASHELRKIHSIIKRNRTKLLEAWNGYFSPRSR